MESTIAYYEYTVDGQIFYSAHYDVGGGKRDDTSAYVTGHLMSKSGSTGAMASADRAEAAAGK